MVWCYKVRAAGAVPEGAGVGGLQALRRAEVAETKQTPVFDASCEWPPASVRFTDLEGAVVALLKFELQPTQIPPDPVWYESFSNMADVAYQHV